MDIVIDLNSNNGKPIYWLNGVAGKENLQSLRLYLRSLSTRINLQLDSSLRKVKDTVAMLLDFHYYCTILVPNWFFFFCMDFGTPGSIFLVLQSVCV
jgi:hypothetical protein